jgi:hypothetical protein
MTTFEDVRQAAVTKLKTYMDATYPTVIVDYENRLRVDLLQQTQPFLTFEVEFNDGEQASIENNPIHRYSGAFCMAVFVREQEGSALQNTYLQALSDQFKTTSFSGVNTRTAKPMPGEGWRGWWKKGIRVPFWFDSFS